MSDFHPDWGNLCTPQLPFMRFPPQKNCPPETVKRPDSRNAIRILVFQEWYLTDDSNFPGRKSSQSTTYTAQEKPKPNFKIQSSFIGSFCPGVNSPHLHGTSLFHRVSLRDSAQSRYAFRAGLNLPDNEFRYLRIVIVTTAIDQGLGRQLFPKNNQLPWPSGIGQASAPIPSLDDFAETCVFGKQSPGPSHCDLLFFFCKKKWGTSSSEVTRLVCRVP
jgi:hypothetical protein